MTKKLPNGHKSTLTCPDCVPTRRLVVKTNGNDNGQFLACPGCRHTEDLPPDMVMGMSGQPRLL